MILSSPRLTKDENGTWWYFTGQHRTRANRGTCCNCGEEFVCRPCGNDPKLHCLRACYLVCKKAGRHPAPVDAYPGKAEKSTRWTGGYINRRGYMLVYAPDHHSIVGRETQRNYVLEHRMIMERVLGRNLSAKETVHHINGIKDDNRPENLQLRSGNHGQGVVLACADCGSRDVVKVPLG